MAQLKEERRVQRENVKLICSDRRAKHMQDVALLEACREQLLLHGISVPSIRLLAPGDQVSAGRLRKDSRQYHPGIGNAGHGCMPCMQADGHAPRHAATAQDSSRHPQPHLPPTKADEQTGQQEGTGSQAKPANTCQQAAAVQSRAAEPAGTPGRTFMADGAVGTRRASTERTKPPPAPTPQRPPLRSTQAFCASADHRVHGGAQEQAAQSGKRGAQSSDTLREQPEVAQTKRAKLADPAAPAHGHSEGRSSAAAASPGSRGPAEVLPMANSASGSPAAAPAPELLVAPEEAPVLSDTQQAVFQCDDDSPQQDDSEGSCSRLVSDGAAPSKPVQDERVSTSKGVTELVRGSCRSAEAAQQQQESADGEAARAQGSAQQGEPAAAAAPAADDKSGLKWKLEDARPVGKPSSMNGAPPSGSQHGMVGDDEEPDEAEEEAGPCSPLWQQRCRRAPAGPAEEQRAVPDAPNQAAGDTHAAQAGTGGTGAASAGGEGSMPPLPAAPAGAELERLNREGGRVTMADYARARRDADAAAEAGAGAHVAKGKWTHRQRSVPGARPPQSTPSAVAQLYTGRYVLHIKHCRPIVVVGTCRDGRCKGASG